MIPKKIKNRKERNMQGLMDEAEKIRKELEAKVYRRKDGVLQCPPSYAEGYGIQSLKITH